VVLIVSDGLKKKYGFQKIPFLWLGIFLAGGLMLLLQPEVLPAQKKTPGTDQFQRLDLPETTKKLVSI